MTPKNSLIVNYKDLINCCRVHGIYILRDGKGQVAAKQE